MSCERTPICIGGKTFYAYIQLNPRGDFLSAYYLDENLIKVSLSAGGFAYGECKTPVKDVFKVTQALIAGSNTITDNLGFIGREVEVRNASTGAIITARLISEAPNSFVIFVPVAVASATVSSDV